MEKRSITGLGRKFFSAAFIEGDTPRIGAPVLLFEGDCKEPTPWVSNVFFDAVNRRFLLTLSPPSSDQGARLEVITNWLQQVSRN